jgi:putative nucleotidyltransferase with HDIG domain
MVASPEKTLNGMRFILDKKLLNNGSTVEHTQRVVEISLSIGKEIGLPPDELEDLHWGALLHDIGKIAVDPEILNKPGALTLEEYRHVMTHSIVGCNIAKNMVNGKVLEIISHHHDYYDGSGLNQTIAGEDIPLGARILALADAFDAMTSDRPYRSAISHEEAFMEIKRCSRTQFAPCIVSTFLKMNLFPRPALQDAMATLNDDRR